MREGESTEQESKGMMMQGLRDECDNSGEIPGGGNVEEVQFRWRRDSNILNGHRYLNRSV